MSTRQRYALVDMDLDEVSTVGIPANQLGMIVLAKSAGSGQDLISEEGSMPGQELYDAEGRVVDPEALEVGDYVYDGPDDEAEEFQVVPVDEDGYILEDELELVGKAGELEMGGRAARYGAKASKARRALQAQGDRARAGAGRAKNYMVEHRPTASPGEAGEKWHTGGREGYRLTSEGKRVAGYAGAGAGALGAAGGGGYAAGRRGHVGKSFAQSILDDVSKAVTTDDQISIVAKALQQSENERELLIRKSAQLEARLNEAEDAATLNWAISKAAEYNLPIDADEFGPILKRLVENMPERDMYVLDELFKSIGATFFEELGYNGGSPESSYDYVAAAAQELVAKTGASDAQAITAMYNANPDAYDAYLAEGR
jgi:hypothetical protein